MFKGKYRENGKTFKTVNASYNFNNCFDIKYCVEKVIKQKNSNNNN